MIFLEWIAKTVDFRNRIMVSKKEGSSEGFNSIYLAQIYRRFNEPTLGLVMN